MTSQEIREALRMSAEQKLRADDAALEEVLSRAGKFIGWTDEEAESIARQAAAVGRLLDPIPDEAIEAMAGDWLTVHIRRDLAEKMLSGYRAWLISGDSDDRDARSGVGVEGDTMSAPTPKWSDDHTLAVIAGDLATEWPATPADVRLWLLEAGAEERQWCETHEESGGEGVCYFAMHYGEIRKCRMVSVLVWRTPDSEQVSPATN